MKKMLACPFCSKARPQDRAICVMSGFCGAIGPWRTTPKSIAKSPKALKVKAKEGRQ